MQVTVQLFGLLKESIGEVTKLTLSEPYTAHQLLVAFVSQHPEFLALQKSLLVVADERYISSQEPLNSSQKLALFPPLGGGSASQNAPQVNQQGSVYHISEQPIILPELLAEMSQPHKSSTQQADKLPQIGAINIFLGTVRGNNQGQTVRYLEYQAHCSMAFRQLDQLDAELRKKWGIQRMVVSHRLGMVLVGETSLAVLVGTLHRKEALAACQYAVEWIKAQLPIWKKEVTVAGQQWIENSSKSNISTLPSG